MSEFDQSQKEFWSENTNLRAYDHPVVKAFARQRVEFIRGLLDAPIQNCLEVGCGDGFGMFYMQSLGQVFGCDISRPMLRRNPLRQSVAEADIYRLPYADKSFDLVYCWEVLHHVKDMQSAIREMMRLSRRFILLYEPNAFNPLQVGFGLIAPSELGTLRFHPWYMRNHFRRARLTHIRTFTVGAFTPNRTPLWLYKNLGRIALPYPSVWNFEFGYSASPIMKQLPQLTVVVPIYNEAESLPAFLPRLIDFCRARGWELVLVNDGSSDDSKQILESRVHPPAVRVIHHKVNRGYGGALKTGLLDANTPYVVTIDGDGQHEPDDIQRLLEFTLEHGADLVIGRRDLSRGRNWYRELGKTIIRRFTRLLMPLPIQDLNSGFKLYRTELVQAYLPVCPDSMAFSDVIALTFINQKDLVLEHPIRVNLRKQGKSTISTYTAFETIMEILNLVMLFNPLKIFLSLSAICFAFGILWGTPILLLNRGVSVGAMLAIVSGLIFFFIGLVASQLSSIRLGDLSARRRKHQ